MNSTWRSLARSPLPFTAFFVMALSPMMQQYHDAKAACGDALLLFRMGDFYELFYDDARRASEILGITLTSRDKGENAIPMAGFPYHQLESYLAKLIHSGVRAAICEQVENPKQAKGLVKREVTRIVSRGTLTEDALLAPEQANFLAAWLPGDPIGLAWVDVSTGQFCCGGFAPSRAEQQLAALDAVELLFPDASDSPPPEGTWQVTRRAAYAFNRDASLAALSQRFGPHALEGFGFTGEHPQEEAAALRAAGALLDYLSETQRAGLAHLRELTRIRRGESLEIDPAARRSLELTRTMREGTREGSLLGVIDRTVTAMGSRLLAQWLAHPLVEVPAIEARHQAVGECAGDERLRQELRSALKAVYDLPRLLARITTGRSGPRDLLGVRQTLAQVPAIKARLEARHSRRLQQLCERLDLCADLRGPLDSALEDEVPHLASEGGFVRIGYDGKLDELRQLTKGGKEWIAAYQAREAERIGVPGLKVGFNKVFGYYLEITHAHTDKVPAEYIRKQTIKSAERYITPELKKHEERVLRAEEDALELELAIFHRLRQQVAEALPRLATLAEVLAETDVLAALAELAIERNYCCPVLSSEPVTHIVAGRHPVLDISLPAGEFVPNDTALGGAQGSSTGTVLLITGPNMAGKSTYIRQVALLTILAQMGSFVPAEAATIGVADRVFARVGASDELAKGQSTFMVEMTEAARILNQATPQSLVILDEIGRGTSTYDGLSLAWSMVEYLDARLACRTLFATHYHELTQLADELPQVANLNVAVREHGTDVVFLHRIEAGAANKSYGIHVAKLAGVPRAVVARAEEILSELESHAAPDADVAPAGQRRATDLQLTLFEIDEHPIVAELRSCDADALTPREALALLWRWKDQLAE